MSSATPTPNDLQAYEMAVLAFLSAAQAIAAQLQSELHKLVLAQGRWNIAKGGKP